MAPPAGLPWPPSRPPHLPWPPLQFVKQYGRDLIEAMSTVGADVVCTYLGMCGQDQGAAATATSAAPRAGAKGPVVKSPVGCAVCQAAVAYLQVLVWVGGWVGG